MEPTEIERLERLSDNIRKGMVVSLNEALEVIVYQQGLKDTKIKSKSFLYKILKWIGFSKD